MKVHVGPDRIVATAEGNGPVNALDGALRAAIGPRFPALDHSTSPTTGSGPRHGPGHRGGDPRPGGHHRRRADWTTIGVSENIIEASWQALYDSIVFGLLHAD